MEATDVVIVTAAAGEDEAVRLVCDGALTRWTETQGPGGHPVWRCSFLGKAGRSLSIVLSRAIEQRGDATAAMASALVQHFRPRCLAMCGVCAGRPGWTELGDVVIADRVYRYDAGERQGGLRVAHDVKTYLLAPLLEQAARRVCVPKDVAWVAERPVPLEIQRLWILAEVRANRDPTNSSERDLRCANWGQVLGTLWVSGFLRQGTIQITASGEEFIDQFLLVNKGIIPARPHVEVKVGPMATGSDLIQDDAIWAELAESQRLILGIDMEAAAIGATAHAFGVPYQIIAKGVMDFAERERVRFFFPFAARASAEVLIALLRENIEPASPSARDVLAHHTYSDLPAATPSALLNARYQVVPFDNATRRTETDAIVAWCSAADELSVWLYYGPGGSGKTRLFVELCHRYRQLGWAAGFLADGNAALNAVGPVLTDLGAVLAVVDYAEARPELLSFLQQAIERRGGGKLRIILLAREVAGWWSSLSESDERVREILARRAPTRLSEISREGAVRQRLFLAATRAFAGALGKSPPSASIDFDEQQFSGPLYLHMAALAAVEGLSSSDTNLLGPILDHEARFWIRSTAPSLTSIQRRALLASARRFVAALTLRGGAPTIEAAETIAGFSGLPSDGAILTTIRDVFPGSGRDGSEDRYAGYLEPDLLGEALVLGVLSNPETPERFLRESLCDASDAAVRTALIVLGRAAIRHRQDTRKWIRSILEGDPRRAIPAVEAALALGNTSALAPVGEEVVRLLDVTGGRDAALWILAHVPLRTVSLARVAVWATRRVLAELPADAESAFERARLLNDLSVRLATVGDRQGAVVAARSATEQFRLLDAESPGEFSSQLATALDNLGRNLNAEGQASEASGVAREAVEFYRGLAKLAPDPYRLRLAKSLDGLGSILAESGDRSGALTASEEAVDLLRQLAKQSEAFLPDLASTLHNLGARLTACGNRSAALVVTRESLSITQALARARPDAFLPDLAGDWLNLGSQLADIGSSDEALAASREATRLYRELAKAQPGAFVPRLAKSLDHLSMRLRRSSPLEAIASAQEAAALFRALAEAERESFRPELAACLTNLSNTLHAAGEYTTAVKVAQEAANVYRDLDESHPGQFREGLAASLQGLGDRLYDTGDAPAALMVLQEATAIHRALASEHPEAFADRLAISLCSVSRAMSATGSHSGALAPSDEAVALLRALDIGHLLIFRESLAACLQQLGLALGASGELVRSVDILREATEILRQLAAEDPSGFQGAFAHGLSNLRDQLFAASAVADAIVVAREVTALFRLLANNQPDEFIPPLASSLSNLCRILRSSDNQTAIDAGRDASNLFRELTRKNAGVFGPHLITSLLCLAACFDDDGNDQEALTAEQEATALIRELNRVEPGRFLRELAACLEGLLGRFSKVGDRAGAAAVLGELESLRSVADRGRKVNPF